jgi:predicted nuclease of predicted toxin-antitoxin system
VKLLLDEMWPARAAVQLRRGGHDVVAIAERSELRGQPDPVVFAMAQGEGRAVVTENASDYCPLAAAELTYGRSHAGLVLTSNRRFPRHDPRTLGRLVRGLDELMTQREDSTNMEHWL